VFVGWWVGRAQAEQATQEDERAAAAAAARRTLQRLTAIDPVRVRYWAWCSSQLPAAPA